MAEPNGRLNTRDLSPIPAAFHTHGTTAYMQAHPADAFLRVAYAFEARFGKRLVAMSFYRPLSDQVRIFLKNYTRVNRPRRRPGTDRSYNGHTYALRSGMAPVASPGYSNHGLGITVDFNAGVQRRGSTEHNWMLAEGTKYGWDWTEGRRIGEPWHWSYVRGQDRMRNARRASATTTPARPPVSTAETVWVQQHLRDLGYNPGPIDGSLGPTTTAAVRAFQTDFGLTADGKPGPNTRTALGDAMSKLNTLIEKVDRAIAIGAENQRRISALPTAILDAPVKLEGSTKGTTTLRKKIAWLAHEQHRTTDGVTEGTAKILARLDKLEKSAPAGKTAS